MTRSESERVNRGMREEVNRGMREDSKVGDDWE